MYSNVSIIYRGVWGELHLLPFGAYCSDICDQELIIQHQYLISLICLQLTKNIKTTCKVTV